MLKLSLTRLTPDLCIHNNMIYKNSKSKGFTLIELLVVISIISLLASVILASLNSARAKARNAKRLGDARELVNAFALSLNDNSSLPSSGGVWACISATCYGTWSGYVANATVDNFLSPYIKKAVDPSDGTRGLGGYLYYSVWGGGPSGSGSYIDWTVEPGGSCGFGVVDLVLPGDTECVYKVD